MTFANPAAFWLLLAAAPLVAMYFLKVHRQRVRVPSLQLWASVVLNQRKARPWDRFRRHDLLWLQLLALLLLTLALAAPSIPGRRHLGRSVVWVLDGSASMAAHGPSPTRFDLARGRLIDEIGQLRAGDEGMVLFAGAEPRVAASFTRDHDTLIAATRALKPSAAAASLGAAVDLAAALSASRDGRTLVVVTDGSDRSLDSALTRHPEVRVEAVGRSVPNVAITAVDLRRSASEELEAELFVTLRRFGGEEAPVGIEVTLGEQLIASDIVPLPTDKPVARVFGGLTGGGLVTVKLQTGDALPADDVAFAWLDPPTRRTVRCVGCTALTARALATDPRFRVEVGGTGPADLMIYEGGVVPAEPPAPFLALGPSALGAAPAADEVEWPRVTTWRRSHPTLRFVEPAGLHVTRARPGDATWEPLLESDVGPLLTTGILGGQRGVALHFAPTDSDLPLRVAWPIFLLNTASWLTGEESRGTSRTLVAGRPLLREGWGQDGDVVSLEFPDGQQRGAPIRDGVARFGALDQIGVHKLVGPDGRQERLAVNLASETESDLTVVPHAPLKDRVDEGVVAPGRQPIARPLLGLLCLVLLGEWALFQRRYWDA